MTAPYEVVCVCGRTVHRTWPPGEHPLSWGCEWCEAAAEREGLQLTLEIGDDGRTAIATGHGGGA